MNHSVRDKVLKDIAQSAFKKVYFVESCPNLFDLNTNILENLMFPISDKVELDVKKSI